MDGKAKSQHRRFVDALRYASTVADRPHAPTNRMDRKKTLWPPQKRTPRIDAWGVRSRCFNFRLLKTGRQGVGGWGAAPSRPIQLSNTPFGCTAATRLTRQRSTA